MKTCEHGERVYRSGRSAKGPWAAHFCPLPKDDPFACSPEWEKVKDEMASVNEDLAKEIQNIHRKLDTIINLLSPNVKYPPLKVVEEQEVDISTIPF